MISPYENPTSYKKLPGAFLVSYKNVIKEEHRYVNSQKNKLEKISLNKNSNTFQINGERVSCKSSNFQQGGVICTQWPMVDFFTINIHYGNMPSYLPSAFCYRNKTDELRARSTRFTPRKTIERFLQRGVKLHCDDLDKNGTKELKRDIMCTLHLQRARISLVSFLCICQ